MRSLVKFVLPLVFFPLALLAQAQMTEQQMQQLMQGATQMQACFAKVDQSGLEALMARAEAVEEELKGMCASGQRRAAQAKAVSFGNEFANSPEMAQLQECSELAMAMMPPMLGSLADLEYPDDDDDVSTHVCDHL